MFLGFNGFAQKEYDTRISKAETTLEGKTLKGYRTHFDYEREEVRRGWWEYAREFGTLLNMKTYYKATLPSTTTDGNVDVIIYAETAPSESGVTFFLGLAEKKYNEQAKNLLLDFKKTFYIERLLDAIKAKERELKKLSDAYRDTVLDDEQQVILGEITLKKATIESLKEEIRKIERK